MTPFRRSLFVLLFGLAIAHQQQSDANNIRKQTKSFWSSFLNESADPCKDFFAFSCGQFFEAGNFKENEPSEQERKFGAEVTTEKIQECQAGWFFGF